MGDSNENYDKRISMLEAANENIKEAQVSLKENQELISRDLRETSNSLRALTNDIGILVTNVTHLTDAISSLKSIIDKTHAIEKDLVEMKTRTDSINRLWEGYESLREKVDSGSVVTSATKYIAGAIAVAAITLIVAKLGGL